MENGAERGSVMSDKYILRESEVKVLGRGWIVFMWQCPICGHRIHHYSKMRALSSAKLHLERKHKLLVVVE